MQIGMRLHDTPKLALEDRLQLIKQQGFTCAHVALSKIIEEYPVNPAALTPGFAMYLKKIFQKNDIDIAVLGCYLNLANPDEKQLKEIVNSYMAHIRFASILGCGVVGTETGAPNIDYKYEPGCRGEEALQIFIKNLRSVIKYAQDMGVIVAIEPVRSHIVYNSIRAKQVLEEIASPNLQIIFDPVNLLGMDNYQQQTEVIEEAIDLLGDAVAVIHMKDFIIHSDSFVSVAAGKGQLNYTPIIKFIKEKKPFIHCTLEDTKPENAVFAKEYIEQMW